VQTCLVILKINTSEALMKVSTYPDFFTRDERLLAVGFTDESAPVANPIDC
jgi:hypothetical protein